MNRRVFGASLVGLTGAFAFAQRGWRQAASTNQPPTARTDAEKRILAGLEEMSKAGELHLAVDPDTGRMLRLLAEAAGAKNVVEIGTSTGYSSLWLSLALQGTGGKLTTFELDSGRAAQARKHFEQAGVSKAVTVVVGDAHRTVRDLKDPIDVLFLDADKEGYTSYLRTLLPLIRPGGLVAADNVEMAEGYIKAVATDPELDTVFFGRLGVTLKKR